MQAVNIENLGLGGSMAEVIERNMAGEERIYSIRLHVPGGHMVSNALAAITVGRALGLTQKEIVDGIAGASSVDGRSNIIRDDKLTIIDDCYNANPVSMKAAIDLLETATTKKVAILGDMFELGEQEKQLHRSVGEYFASKT